MQKLFLAVVMLSIFSGCKLWCDSCDPGSPWRNQRWGASLTEELNRYRNEADESQSNQMDYSLSSSGLGHDLESISAKIERKEIQLVASGISEEFGLSVQRSEQIARIAIHSERISNQRELTINEKDILVESVFGVEISRIEDVFKGNLSENQTNDLLEEVARTNGTSPEHIKDIIEYLVE